MLTEKGQADPTDPKPLTWRDWFPDLEIPPGLTYVDLNEAVGMLAAWERGDNADGDWSGVYLISRLYALLRSRESSRVGAAAASSGPEAD